MNSRGNIVFEDRPVENASWTFRGFVLSLEAHGMQSFYMPFKKVLSCVVLVLPG